MSRSCQLLSDKLELDSAIDRQTDIVDEVKAHLTLEGDK
jgi:hypothetical protein